MKTVGLMICIFLVLRGKIASTSSVTICEHKKKTISCSNESKIDIISAVYGRSDRTTCPHHSIKTTSCAASTSESVVKGKCNGKSSCNLYASNSVFGDPCYQTFKYLDVKYQCVVLKPAVTICEHKRKQISCPNGKIDIISAVYGRSDRTICPHHSIKTTSCAASTSESVVKGKCNGKSSCNLYASNSVFGDPCYQTFKYLDVKYQCVV